MLNTINKRTIVCTLLLTLSLPILVGATSLEKSLLATTPVSLVSATEASETQSGDTLVEETNATHAAVAAAMNNEQPIQMSAESVSRGRVSNRTIRTLEYLVMDEAGGGSYELQLATAELVMNRWLNGPYGGDLYKIMTAPNAFTGISEGYAFDKVPTEQVKKAVQEALQGKRTGLLTPDTYYCCVPENSKDAWMLDPNKAEFVVEIDNVHFYRPLNE